jgi:predicted nucleic acid-binding protein
MSYYLDTNVIIQLVDLPYENQKLADLHNSSKITLLLAREAMYELTEGPKVSQEDQIKNQRVLDILGLSTTPNNIFQLDKGILGETILGTDQSHDLYESHLENKGNPPKAVSDGIHLANSQALGAIFVSCDGQPRSTAGINNLDKECLIDLFSSLEIETAAVKSCKKCRN